MTVKHFCRHNIKKALIAGSAKIAAQIVSNWVRVRVTSLCTSDKILKKNNMKENDSLGIVFWSKSLIFNYSTITGKLLH